jgi:hypothetical protein
MEDKGDRHQVPAYLCPGVRTVAAGSLCESRPHADTIMTRPSRIPFARAAPAAALAMLYAWLAGCKLPPSPGWNEFGRQLIESDLRERVKLLVVHDGRCWVRRGLGTDADDRAARVATRPSSDEQADEEWGRLSIPVSQFARDVATGRYDGQMFFVFEGPKSDSATLDTITGALHARSIPCRVVPWEARERKRDKSQEWRQNG